MTPTVPLIFTPRIPCPRTGFASRLMATAVALGCLSMLVLAAWLPPNPSGVGTHTALHLGRCQFLDRFDIPCPTCGMTTSFSHFARAHLLASLYVQPMGTVLAVLTAATFWIAAYIAITGKPALRLLRNTPFGYYVIPLMAFAIAAWGWKIYLHLHGIDGWS